MDKARKACGLMFCIKQRSADKGETMARPSYPGFPPMWGFLPDQVGNHNSALTEWLPLSHSHKTRFGEHLSQGNRRECKCKVNVQGQLIQTLDLCIA